jgi:hypothetical protein
MPGRGDARMLTPEEARAEIARAREQITSSMVALRREVSLRTDWRLWVREHPGTSLLGAFMLGFLLGNRR